MLELPLDWNGASVEASEAQCLSFSRQRKVCIAKVLPASVNQTCGEMVPLPLCLLRVSCHISVYAATCYIAIVGSAAPDQLPHFRRLHVNVEVRLLFRSVLGVRLTSTAFPQLKPCFYNNLMPYQWICTSVASTHSCAGDGVMMSECLFVCPEAGGFMYSPQIPKNQHAKRLKCIRLNQICDGDWLHIEIFRCLWFATNWKLLFFPSREAAKLPPADIFPPHRLSISMYAFGHRWSE